MYLNSHFLSRIAKYSTVHLPKRCCCNGPLTDAAEHLLQGSPELVTDDIKGRCVRKTWNIVLLVIGV